MKKTFTAGEIQDRLNRIKATTSVWVPMGNFILVKIFLQRRKEKFSSLVMKAVISEIEKSIGQSENFTREEIVYELRSLKKAPSRLRAAEMLGINPGEVLLEDDVFARDYEISRHPPLDFVLKQKAEKKEEAKSQREVDQFFAEALKQIVDRLGKLEEKQNQNPKSSAEG